MKRDTKIKVLLKWSQVVAQIARFFVEASILATSKDGLLKQRALLCQKYSKRVLKILNVELLKNRAAFEITNGLVVCNHLSYLDILILSAEIPALFVTSIEVKNSGWAGKLSELAGCLFVERRSRENRDLEVEQIEIALSAGVPVVVFPEATSSDGQKVLPFKSTLYECAIRARVPIHNFMIRYQNEEVPYYGDMTLLTHLFKLTSVEKVSACLDFLETFPVSETMERRALAQASEALIRKSYVSRI